MSARVLVLLIAVLVVGLQVSASSASTQPSIEFNSGHARTANARGVAGPSVGMAAKFGGSFASESDAGSAPMGAAPAMMAAKELSADLPADATRTRLIETANGNILVKHLRQSLDKLQVIVRGADGTVSAQNERDLRDNGTYGTAVVTVRVPVQKFRTTWDTLLIQLATKVIHASTTAEDITEQYVDTAIRLKNLEATHAQLLKILETATTVSDVLEVHRELAQVSGNLESMKGRLTYLERSSSMATIHLQLSNYEQPILQPVLSWSPGKTFFNAISGFVSVSKALVDGAIYTAVFGIPILIVWGLASLTVSARSHSS